MKVTSGRLIRERMERGVVLRAPSGNVYRVGSVSPELLIRLGRMPDALIGTVMEVVMGKRDELPVPTTIKDAQDMIAVVDEVARVILLEPRVVESPTQDNEIALSDLEEVDKKWLFGLINMTIRQLETFREEPKGDVGTLDTSERHGDTGQPVIEPAPVGTHAQRK